MRTDTTELLTQASRGDEAAAARLMPLVYDELRALAGHYLARGGEGGASTLQPTAIVHEAFLRLVGHDKGDFKGKTHFYAVAAVAMRHVLIDHVRGRKRAKRGGEWKRITLADGARVSSGGQLDLLTLDEALTKLAELDERAARVVELRYFSGMTDREIAEALGISERTVRNDWTMARAWLRCELSDSTGRDQE